MRRRKTPARIRNDDRIGEDFHATSSSEAVRLKSLEALDLVIAGLDSRFDSDDIKVAAAREEYVMEALSSPAEELETDDLNLPACVDTVQLKCELKTLSAGFERCPTNLQEVCAMLNSMEGSSKAMFREVKKALSLILSLTCTVASCERSFSMLRRLKKYLRATIGQRRLFYKQVLCLFTHNQQTFDITHIISITSHKNRYHILHTTPDLVSASNNILFCFFFYTVTSNHLFTNSERHGDYKYGESVWIWSRGHFRAQRTSNCGEGTARNSGSKRFWSQYKVNGKMVRFYLFLFSHPTS